MSKPSPQHILNFSRKPLQSLSIFFPFFNDEKTVAHQIDDAYQVGSSLTDDLEVIAIHGGASKDNTFPEILTSKKNIHHSLSLTNLIIRKAMLSLKKVFLLRQKNGFFIPTAIGSIMLRIFLI